MPGYYSYQVGVPYHKNDQMDLYQENEELKEEVQKLAAKVNTDRGVTPPPLGKLGFPWFKVNKPIIF